MWPGFDGKPYDRDGWTQHVVAIGRPALSWCKFITLHNTSAPTLKQWVESGPAHDARIRNLESYYEHELGWHAGPHAFISRSWINGFSDLRHPGVHASCFNGVSIGLEMAGEFDDEDFLSGDGAMVAEMAVHAAAVLHWVIGISPEDFTYGVKGLHFHIDCKRDNHDCPGTTARDRPALIKRIRDRMGVLSLQTATSSPAPAVTPLPDGVPTLPPVPTPSPRVPDGAPARMTGILATEFGGADDPQSSAYGGRVDGNSPQVALPARLSSDRRKVRVIRGDKSVICKVNDIGPWNTNDAYWEHAGGRPASEAQHTLGKPAQNRRVPSNSAGIDMTPAAFVALGLPRNEGMTTVDWEFV